MEEKGNLRTLMFVCFLQEYVYVCVYVFLWSFVWYILFFLNISCSTYSQGNMLMVPFILAFYQCKLPLKVNSSIIVRLNDVMIKAQLTIKTLVSQEVNSLEVCSLSFQMFVLQKCLMHIKKYEDKRHGKKIIIFVFM